MLFYVGSTFYVISMLLMVKNTLSIFSTAFYVVKITLMIKQCNSYNCEKYFVYFVSTAI